jgi:predicted AlkP superfamily phosphohydrolase/phosphomutase
VTAALLAATLACGSTASRPAPAPRTPVVVIGLDGATLRVMDPLLANNELPTLAALSARGAHGILESFPPGASPVVWTTIVTGVSPERHGIRGFLARQPGRPLAGTVPSTDRKVPALWNVASDAGLRVGVIGWWATWPAEAIHGFVVADTLVKTGEVDHGTTPPTLAPRLADVARAGPDPDVDLERILGTEPHLACPRWIPGDAASRSLAAVPPGSKDGRLCEAIRRDLATTQIARTLLARERPDVLFVYLKGIDTVSHAFWNDSFPGDAAWRRPPPPEEVARYQGVVGGYYRLTDRLIGRILESSPRATVFVVSDHGFRADPDAGGYRFAYDRLLSDLGYLAGEDGQRDWSRTVAYHDATPFANVGNIWLNLVERSPQGIVPLSEYAAKLAQIAAKLSALRTGSNRPLFAEVVPDPSPPLARRTPDIRLVPTASLDPADAAVVAGRTIPISSYLVERDVSGAHSGDTPADVEGIVFAAGRGVVRRTDRVRARVFDVAPTLACLLGLRLPVRPEGTPSTEILDPRTLEACGEWTQGPPPSVPARETPPPFPRDDELREELRSLGYVE